jgi:phosphocarrier protein FPr
VLGIGAGTPLVLDGEAGSLDIDPDPERLADFERRRDAARARARSARVRAHEPAKTRDGATITVSANAGSAADARAAVELGADGIGLLRTEFLFLDRETAPTEGEQRAVYEEVATALEGRPLIIRTLDAGADKPLLFLAQPPEDNPFLGRRGIRLGLAHPELLLGQLRAIVATAAAHPVRVMFPMVATLAELRAARSLLDEARADAPPPPVGVMVEVPAVALAAERFAREVDFFSIGTNDLTQYTMAAERGNAAVAELLSGALPPVLGLVAAVVNGAAAHGRHVGVCGELAGDPAAAVLLAGLGVDELSMAAPRIPEVKAALREVDLEHARRVALEALEVEDAGATAALLAPLLGG